jgi:FAD/FMN-containing dehydrogenase
MPLETPVILLIFRRPDLTAQVFAAIRQAQPKRLLVVADGPRNPAEAELCQQARAVTEQIDWDCQVSRDYVDVNLGSRKRVSSGLDWAFEQVSEAIILEDDCLPHPSFFSYCQTLLAHYRENPNIYCISGNNFQKGQWHGEGSYYFSNYPLIWGWATWRRAWQCYDHQLATWPALDQGQYLAGILDSDLEVQYWQAIFDQLCYQNHPDAWDYAWTLTCWRDRGLSIVPNVNLVSNIGFRDDATHTREVSDRANLSTTDIGEITHPRFLLRDALADRHTFDHVFGGIELALQQRWYNQIKKRLKGMVKTGLKQLNLQIKAGRLERL